MSTLHDSAVVVDAHNDLLGLVAQRPPSKQATYFRTHWLPQLNAGGVNVQVLPVCSPTLSELFLTLDAGHRIAEANSDSVTLCFTGADVDDALSESKIALILSLESCEAIGAEITMLETMFRLGIRMASLTHLGRTALADGSAEDRADSQLTRAGIEALAVMEELGILLDVSHLSAAGVDDVLGCARRPVIASHSSAFALRQHHRNLTDERLEGVAASGGVVGVNFLAGFIDPDNPTVDRLVDHILHVGATAGMQHVGLGPDFFEEAALEAFPFTDPVIEGIRLKQVIPELGGPKGLPLVTDALVARGVSEDDIRAILGENWLRVMRAEMGRL